MSGGEMLAKILRQRCEPDQNWLLRRGEATLIALKAALCVLLRRRAKFGEGTTYRDSIDYFGDAVIVAILDGGTSWGDYGTSYWWHEVLTPRSWRKWTYHVMWDGSP